MDEDLDDTFKYGNNSVFINQTPVVLLGNCNSSQSQPCSVFLFSTHAVLMGCLSLVGIVGNTLTIATLYRDSKRNLTSFLLIVLAVFDNGVLALTIPVKSLPAMCFFLDLSGVCWYRYHIWPYVMRYVFPFIPTCHFASVWIIVLVTAHRTLAVLVPHKAKRYASLQSVRWQVFVLACVAVLFNLPRFFELVVTSRALPCKPSQYLPSIEMAGFYHNKMYQIIYKNVAMKVFLDFGPLILLSILTYLLICELHRAIGARKALMQDRPEHSQRSSGGGAQLTVLLVLVVVVFLCCQIPHTVYSVLRLVLPRSKQGCGTIYYYFMNISDALMIFNSAVNFLLYCVAGKRFRQQLKSLFCRYKSYNRNSMKASYYSGGGSPTRVGNHV